MSKKLVAELYLSDEIEMNGGGGGIPLSGGEISGDLTLLSSNLNVLSGGIDIANGKMGLHDGDFTLYNGNLNILSGCVNVFTGDIGVLSGNIGVTGGDLKVLSGNYIQTNSISNVYNFSGKNSFLQAEEAKSGSGASYGMACTGAMGYCILSVNAQTNSIKLSGDISKILGSEISSYAWSYALAEGAGTSCFHIIEASQTELSAGVIKIDNMASEMKSLTSLTEESCIWRYENDDNGIYCPLNPSLGNSSLVNFIANHAEGGSTKALGKYTHAEGRGTIADIRYAHAEGSHTYAGGMAAHAEGMGSPTNLTLAMGDGSHAEGQTTKAYGAGSHSEGQNTVASGSQSHAEGLKNSAIGVASHAEGYGENIAYGQGSHAEGDGSCYAGTMSFNIISADDALSTITLDSTTGLTKGMWIAGGYQAQTSLSSTFGWTITEVLPENTIKVNYLPFTAAQLKNKGWICVPTNQKLGTTSRGEGAHVEGWSNFAYTDSHAEGVRNIAIGKFSHCSGIANKTGWGSTAIGKGNSALGFESIAMGGAGNGDSGSAAYDSGTVTLAQKSFAWSGNGKYVVEESKTGTFNINPKNGINGIYVGSEQLGFNNKEFDLNSGAGVMEALQEIIKKLGGKIKPTLSE